MIKRLAHRNANVQLYTLELANALSQNCGIKMHKELASRSFTDALLRLAADRVSTRFLYGREKVVDGIEEMLYWLSFKAEKRYWGFYGFGRATLILGYRTLIHKSRRRS